MPVTAAAAAAETEVRSDFNDIQLCLRQFCFNLNICKVMTISFKFWPKKIRKTVIISDFADIEIQAKLNSQSWISSKSIMQLTKTIFHNSAIFIEKKMGRKSIVEKVHFCGEKELIHILMDPS